MITLISNHADLSTSGEKSSSLAMEKASCNLFLSLLKWMMEANYKKIKIPGFTFIKSSLYVIQH